MNKNVMIVLAGGFVVAILVAVLVQASLGGKSGGTKGPQVQVLVAAKDLPIGTELGDSDLKWQAWPGERAFTGAIIRKDDEQKASDALKGRTIEPVSAGQPVLQSYIFKEGKGNLVAAMMKKDMRAVAIPVKADTMAGGFVSPGDYVDVILTYSYTVDRANKTAETDAFINKHASETILSHVRVLAVDQEAGRDQEKAKIARTVTLEVDAKGAEKIALGAKMGDLRLALRRMGDETVVEGDNGLTTDVEMSRAIQNVNRIKSGGSGSGPVRIYDGTTVIEMRPHGGAEMVFDEKNSGSAADSDGAPANEENNDSAERNSSEGEE